MFYRKKKEELYLLQPKVGYFYHKYWVITLLAEETLAVENLCINDIAAYLEVTW